MKTIEARAANMIAKLGAENTAKNRMTAVQILYHERIITREEMLAKNKSSKGAEKS